MLIDKFGTAHSSNQQAAVSAFEDAVFAVAAHRPVGSALQTALEHDPGLVAAHALTGFANVILGRAETASQARTLLPAAQKALAARDGGTASERALVSALELASDGHLQDAAARLDTHLRSQPCDFLCLKISHALRFMGGRCHAMLDLTTGLLPDWSPSQPAYGFVLGCHSFALEENGHLTQAESFGRNAYANERADAWGLHAVSHVMETAHRTDEGIRWLESSRADWSRCNNFSFHMGWHLALFLLEQGRIDDVVDIYDRDIRPDQTDDFRDMANATSLLWRLELEGLRGGERWSELYEVAKRRRQDVTYVFASLHYLLALAASNDQKGADELLAALEAMAADPKHDQAKVAAEVGVPLAKVIIAMSRGGSAVPDLAGIANSLPIMGGSHAQRDVFLRTLLMAAASRGDSPAFLAISRIRHNLRSSDRFIVGVEKLIKDRNTGHVSMPPALLAS